MVGILDREELMGQLRLWINALDSEIFFWQKHISKYGKTDYGSDVELGYTLSGLSGGLKVLDVGSGPFSWFSAAEYLRTLGSPISLTACDPLAPAYKAILLQNGLESIVETDFAYAERLSDRYQENSFDIVHMRNAMDHSIAPFLVLTSLLCVCSPGGLLVLKHFENEAEFNSYTGLHQWNITVENGAPLIWNQVCRFNVVDFFGNKAELIDCRVTPIQSCGRNWIEWSFRKNFPLTGEFLDCQPAEHSFLSALDEVIFDNILYSKSKVYKKLMSANKYLYESHKRSPTDRIKAEFGRFKKKILKLI